MTRFVLYKKDLEIEVKVRSFEKTTEKIEEALHNIDVWDGVNGEEISVFETREEGLKELQKYTNYYKWMHGDRYDIDLYTLEEEEWDEEGEYWYYAWAEYWAEWDKEDEEEDEEEEEC